ncbi:HNH endonuclease [Devosia sp. MC1541]|uniref:HNH endonuclease n=1 Tax=Devosia sp. MC1541 TaxID=2725264 RepID=UPI00145D3D77|nr:HNH endonuclease [Devosia sp. MC1541]
MLELVPHTKRRGMTKARAAKIFLAHNGKCCNCGQQIRPGEKWFVEHPTPLAQGGADDDTNTAPAHTKCKAAKDATDAAKKAKRDRIVTQGWDRPKRSQLQSRGFAKAQPQKTATRPLVRRSEQV